ncbi:MAG: TIGR01777 family oxidoreductase [Planctomycetaceae bacterium]|nr:TIGR01777 family oxidoreductase [Planctomycetaceae bacterium]
MRLMITGSSGMVGMTLWGLAHQAGHQVVRLVRRAPRSEEERGWDPAHGDLSVDAFDGIDAVVHLAGDNIGSGRWTASKKQRIRESRVQGTQLLAERLAQTKHKPALICASAIGYYGDRGDEVLNEGSGPGADFLASVCQDWERAADPARAAGVRVVHNRLGIVLNAQGGALASMLLPFRLGVGGVMGSGDQYWSWISLEDAARVFLETATNDDWEGIVNVVAPRAVTNREFTKALGAALHRPTIFPMPAFAARLVLGEMADALILASTRVQPDVLLKQEFDYRHPELPEALTAALA